MSDEFDPGLRRLFAATAEEPADDAFVSAVTVRASRERRWGLFAWAVGLLAFAVVLALVIAVLGPVLEQSAGLVARMIAGTPLGWAAGLALAVAGFVCVRLLAPLLARRP
jgi:hypothetical protein